MRSHRLLLPLTVALALGSASPAMAADWSIDVGDTVIWNFLADGHTTTARAGQADRWNSGPETSAAGTPYQKTFSTPGRFRYVCLPHRRFMKGTIVVGKDAVKDTVDGVKRQLRGDDVKVTFELNEAATATYRIKGPSRRTVKEGRVKAGRHSFRLKNLKPGSYRGTLTLLDDFHKRTVARNRFVVP
jgi:opacity protein-like surface antigen